MNVFYMEKSQIIYDRTGAHWQSVYIVKLQEYCILVKFRNGEDFIPHDNAKIIIDDIANIYSDKTLIKKGAIKVKTIDHYKKILQWVFILPIMNRIGG